MKVQFNSKKPAGPLAVLVFVALLLAACQPAATSMPTAAATATTAPQPTSTTAPMATPTLMVPETGGTAAGAATLMVATDPTLGPILVDSKGMTLYMFTKDEPDKSNCTGGCLEAWPPFLTEGEPVAGDGVDASLLGTTTMADGTTIVTYNQMPLYYWASDVKAGDTSGQGVNDVWYVVAPDGKPVGMPASMPADAATQMVATDPTLGPILVDGKGMTLYMFTKDEPDKSNCSGGCLTAWPPFLADGAPVAGEGVDSALIGTATMADGTTIVTYNQMPLYYWAADTKPGDTSGQGVNDVWYVVAPDGKPVGMPQSSINPYGSDY